MVEQVYPSRRGPSAVAWIALIVAVAALVLAWIAYDRTGANLEAQIRTQVEQGIDAIDAGPDGIDEDDTDIR